MVVCIVVTDSCRVAARHVHMCETESGEFGVRRELFMFRRYSVMSCSCAHVYVCFKSVHFISVIVIGPK